MNFAEIKVGFVGAGNMAQALARGMANSGLLRFDQMWASAPTDNTLEVWSTWGAHTVNDNTTVFTTCDIVVLAVKPHVFPVVVDNLRMLCAPANQLVISVMSGVTLADIQKGLSAKITNVGAVVRAMPNTPALVAGGCAVFCMNDQAGREDADATLRIFHSVGLCEQVPESQMNAFTGLSGSGPAYVYLAIEALSDGAVKMGLPRHLAAQFAAQTVLGAAKMVLETGRHPAALKDDVCSPGGTTIAGIHALEKAGFRCALMDAVEAATKRAQEQSTKR